MLSAVDGVHRGMSVQKGALCLKLLCHNVVDYCDHDLIADAKLHCMWNQSTYNGGELTVILLRNIYWRAVS